MTVKTAYISRAYKKGTKISQAATFQTMGGSRLDPDSDINIRATSDIVKQKPRIETPDAPDGTAIDTTTGAASLKQRTGR